MGLKITKIKIISIVLFILGFIITLISSLIYRLYTPPIPNFILILILIGIITMIIALLLLAFD